MQVKSLKNFRPKIKQIENKKKREPFNSPYPEHKSVPISTVSPAFKL